LDEENNLQSYEEAEQALAAMSFSKRKPESGKGEHSRGPMCYNCRKIGHIARYCKEEIKKQYDYPRKQKDNYRNDRNETAFNVTESDKFLLDADEWTMDSGASAHMCYRRDFFVTFTESFNSNVMLGNEMSVEVKGRGTINIQKLINGQWLNSTINDVLYVPDLKRNLFSEGILTKKGMKIVKENDFANVYYNGQLCAVGVKSPNNLYKMLFQTVIYHANNVATDSLRMWHERLGHLNIHSLIQMVSKGLVTGVNLADKENFFCEACCYGKQQKQSFKQKDHSKMKPGERIYSDVCGPMSVPSVQGARYFVTFKDENTGYRVAYFIKHKSDVLDCFKVYNSKIKNKFGHFVKVLHVDNGTEYANYDFKQYLEENGIEVEFTAPYTPQQNGRAERDNRTIVESARSMLFNTKLSRCLWAEAVNTAIYLLNRMQTTQTPNSTPYELWFGQKPTLNHVKVFGCEAFVHVPDQKRSKLDPKSHKLIFVGYDKNSTNYRLYDPESRKITISRNVVFNENARDYVLTDKIVKVAIESDDVTEYENPTENNEPVHELVQLNENAEPVQLNENETEIEQTEPSTSNSRPQRNIKRPSRLEDYELNFVECDIPSTYEEAVSCSDSKQWEQAIKEELEALDENKTWNIVSLPSNQKVVDYKWVFKVKRNCEGNIDRYKARLCAKGFSQRKGIDYHEIYSPTTRYDSIRVLLAIAVKNNLSFQQFDIKTAFLYGDLQENIYMKIPEGLKEVHAKHNLACKLNKSLYGLKQAPRCWNQKFHTFLSNFGLKQAESDKCIYNGTVNNEKVLLILYVDDGLVFSQSTNAINSVLDELKTQFKMKVCKPEYFVGLEITRLKDNSIFISQSNYTSQLLKKFCLENTTPISIPEDPNCDLTMESGSILEEGQVPYRQAIGSLMFLAVVSRPDISHAVGVVSRYADKYTMAHWNAVKRILKYLKKTVSFGITYSQDKIHNLAGFSDADFAGDRQTRKSTSGYVFKMCNGPVTWSSRRQQSVSLSTTESEYIAASEATKEAVWLYQLLSDIGETVPKPVKIYIDNQSAIRLIKNPEFHNRTKHIDIRFHYIREKFECGDIDPVYVESASQEADIFTKALPKVKFEKLRDLLGVDKKKTE